jgi:hypothetical protein
MLQHASSYMNYDRQEIDILSTGNIFNRFRIARVIITTMSGALLLNTEKNWTTLTIRRSTIVGSLTRKRTSTQILLLRRNMRTDVEIKDIHGKPNRRACIRNIHCGESAYILKERRVSAIFSSRLKWHFKDTNFE